MVYQHKQNKVLIHLVIKVLEPNTKVIKFGPDRTVRPENP